MLIMYVKIAHFINVGNLCAMKDDLTYDERKEWARTLYTRNDKGIPDVSLTVGVDEATVRSWAQQGAWEGVRRSLLLSKSTQLECMYEALAQLNARMKENQEINPKDLDQMVKYTTAIKNL